MPVKGYVAGGTARPACADAWSPSRQILANALLAGVASGIGHAFTQSSTTLSVSPLAPPAPSTPASSSKPVWAPAWQALDRLAQYYISLAEKVFPVIEVDAGRSVDVVLTQGVALPGR